MGRMFLAAFVAVALLTVAALDFVLARKGAEAPYSLSDHIAARFGTPRDDRTAQTGPAVGFSGAAALSSGACEARGAGKFCGAAGD